MTQQQAINAIQRDPFFIISLIIENNPQEVYNRILEIGGSVTYNNEAIFNFVNSLLVDQDYNSVAYILDVPWIQENHQELTELLYNMGYICPIDPETRTYIDPNNPVGTYSDLGATGIQTNTGSNFDWSTLFTGIESLAESAGSIIGAYQGTGSTPSYMTPQAPITQKENKNTIYIMVAILVVLIGVIVYLAMRKKK